MYRTESIDVSTEMLITVVTNLMYYLHLISYYNVMYKLFVFVFHCH